jgi:hypothetical protein
MNSSAKIIEQFQRKRADLRCRVCGHASFSLLVNSSEDSEAIKSYIELTNDSPGITRLRTVSTACANCGHIEQFLADLLLDRPLGELK